MSREFDSPWNEAMDIFGRESLEVFCQELFEDIDWSLELESLETELRQIIREGELGPTAAD